MAAGRILEGDAYHRGRRTTFSGALDGNVTSMARKLPTVRKDPLHWLVVLLLIALAFAVGHRLSEKSTWIRLRYRIYSYLPHLGRQVIDVERTALVLIGDDDYWKGELARRVPTKRDYLAKLLRAIDAANPAVIVLDFDLRSPTFDHSLDDHDDYRAETEQFVRAVQDISRRTPIVLPKTIRFDENQDYVIEPAIYDRYDLRSSRVGFGYIELPYDLRQVPLPQAVQGGVKLHSLASAAVEFDNPQVLELANTGKDTLPYGSFAEAEAFPSFSSAHVLQADPQKLRDELGHRIVLVGAGWSRLGHERGGVIDATISPIGLVGKVYLHANYMEALLDQRTYDPINEGIVTVIEIMFALGVAIVFAMKIRALTKFAVFLLICLLVLIVTYIAYTNFGIFFDFLIPLVLLAGHAFVEQVLEWRQLARKCAQLHGIG